MFPKINYVNCCLSALKQTSTREPTDIAYSVRHGSALVRSRRRDVPAHVDYQLERPPMRPFGREKDDPQPRPTSSSPFFTFYSPPIPTMSSGFLQAKGLEPICSVSPPSVSAIKALEDRSPHLIQSPLSQKSGPASKGVSPSVVHFDQVNEMDDFFITACEPSPDINWAELEGVDVVLPGGELLAMSKYACHKAGSATPRSMPSIPGGPTDIDTASPAGQGQYGQKQGPVFATVRI
jgi:hypothetical protein